MANTYHQIYLHFVFAAKNRDALIPRALWDEMYAYAGGIVRHQGHHPVRIGGYYDHLHLLVSYNPGGRPVSEMVKQIKIALNLWINSRIPNKGRFSWQTGYGCFSYSISQVEAVDRYIANQEKHHQAETFLDEYEKCLRKFGIEYDPRYIFHKPE